jgi:8-oxo-dGTP pyrophosphatase MutT (NUDIX family)
MTSAGKDAPPPHLHPAKSSKPALATSVLVLRTCDSEVEILVARRRPEIRFFGGYWVFPGGSVDPADDRLPTAGWPDEGARLPRSFYAAAARELYEEAGLLIARADSQPGSGGIADAPEPNGDPFATLLRQSHVAIDVRQFHLWARWITPEALKRRFDTHFFAVRAPEDQRAQPDRSEIDSVRWIRPRDWAFGAARHEYPIAPPTLFILRELCEELQLQGSLDGLLAANQQRHVLPVLPKTTGDSKTVVFPWDAEYSQLPGETLAWDAEAVASRSHWPGRLSNVFDGHK